MKLDRSKPYGTLVSTDPNVRTTFLQHGIEFNEKGDPVDPSQVEEYANARAAEAQAEAEEAMAAAKAAQERAKAVQKEGDQMVKAAGGEPPRRAGRPKKST